MLKYFIFILTLTNQLHIREEPLENIEIDGGEETVPVKTEEKSEIIEKQVDNLENNLPVKSENNV